MSLSLKFKYLLNVKDDVKRKTSSFFVKMTCSKIATKMLLPYRTVLYVKIWYNICKEYMI
ncbi:hypothetical protein TEMA_16470 [Terrisporobacter mayombei]|uniref:Uncharacterized protein n=1 Tax=Terrisporobacter mayombei TaxID=1541 RepID=A0ABY9Q010_9FIRM|nr:hypothetical protein TEMA_16470 [Terrisporobacter mayombei]